MEVQSQGNSYAAILSLILGAVPAVVFLYKQYKQRKQEAEKPEPFPEDGIFTLESLARFDGRKNPICLGVCGLVVDVSTSENIQAGEGYGKLWAGRDATWSLATLSLKAEDANIMDFKVSELTEEQHKALAGWYKHFTTKYTIVGKLKEYEGWDFSSVVEEAKSQTPFGAPRTDDEAAAEIAEGAKAAAEEKPAAAPAEGLVLKKGEKVKIVGHEKFAGYVGTLEDFDRAAGGFKVKLEPEGNVEVFKPTQ
eukprot:CAMPEP_0206575578 /NCGR_PEP_ID=MMETSP0325_2-20121206/30171_1 /ASSEMBLY_ACC=CAM_ASM_000347 /TAXON_ID=2866 /ORGANISM="Crypthecodinium cohnii, Strain Seligo" /LENGTH=250 /DNA_ID=CAMNT_0054080493 /DNA_START=67 /DNA_END=816 /DNA_ORIENTATION=-